MTEKYKAPFHSVGISQYKWTFFERHYTCRIFVFKITLCPR